MPEAIGAQFELTVNAVGKVSAPGTPLFFNAKYVAPLEKKGIAVTFATPIRMALAPLAPTESTISLYVACNVATGVISVESPALAELVAAPSTSLLPAHTLTNVGCAAIMACICVRPPSMSRVSAFELVPAPGPFFTRSRASAPGTATLVRNGGIVGARKKQVAAVPPPSRCGTPVAVKTVSIGGGQPGFVRLG